MLLEADACPRPRHHPAKMALSCHPPALPARIHRNRCTLHHPKAVEAGIRSRYLIPTMTAARNLLRVVGPRVVLRQHFPPLTLESKK